MLMVRRIGVFDSGIGGLTVLRQLRRAFPQLDMVYLGDLARVPYGGRSVETINRYARDDVEFLLRHDVDAIVVACGTVSSNSLGALREKYSFPIYGVIDSAAARAAQLTRSGSVGVIGTQATVNSGAFDRAIRAIRPDIHVTARACPLIVPLVENAVPPEDILAETVCDRYLADLDDGRTDVLIMGCTHYPLYRTAFEKRLPGVTMIDVGEALSAALRPVFGECPGTGHMEYYVTERSAAFTELVRTIDSTVDPGDIRVAKIG